MFLNNLFIFIIIFSMLCAISVFPQFKQTKKNLIWMVFIFICVSVYMIVDFCIEFLPLAYLLIYVGAVAVMFLFVIVAVDAKSENRIEWFEYNTPIILMINNFLVSSLYFLFTRRTNADFSDVNNFLWFKEMFKTQQAHQVINLSANNGRCEICAQEEIIKNFYGDFILNSGCVYDNLSLYNLIEYRAKDIFVFSEYFFNFHGFLLIIVGLILTASMLVSLLIAQEFSNKNEI